MQCVLRSRYFDRDKHFFQAHGSSEWDSVRFASTATTPYLVIAAFSCTSVLPDLSTHQLTNRRRHAYTYDCVDDNMSSSKANDTLKSSNGHEIRGTDNAILSSKCLFNDSLIIHCCAFFLQNVRRYTFQCLGVI